MTEQPTSQVSDITANSKAVINTTTRAWRIPGMTDSTMAGLGITGLEAEKMRNGGLTNDELKATQQHQCANMPATTGQAR